MKIKSNVAVSDSGFVFNPTSGDSYSVNPVGQYMIQLIKEGKSDEKIVDIFTKEYLIDRDSVEKDLYDFKNLLKNYKLSEDVEQ